MAFTAQNVIQTAQATLQDGAGVRWLPTELLNYLNAGVREIALQKPNATAETTTMDLVAGTKQSLPAGYHKLLSAIRNTANNRAILPVVKEVLDIQYPGWHDTGTLPASPTVSYVMDDMFDVSTFYVCPANDGQGNIEVMMSRLPTPLAAPNDPLDLSAYTMAVQIADIYENCLVDYVCSRAFSKDLNIPGAAQRAQAHYQLFQQALGIKAQVEMAQNVDTPKSRFSQ